jgi:hypothetical protein
MRALVASGVALLVIAGGIDLALTRTAEQQASEQASILLAAPATVDFRGWPVSLRLLFGTIPAVDLHATDVPTDSGVPLRTLDATLTRVRLRLGDLANGELPAEAGDGTLTATLDDEGARAILGDLAESGTVELVPGRVRFTVLGFTVESGVTLEQEVLVLTPVSGPRGLPDRLEVPLPELPPGIHVERVEVLTGALQLEGTFTPEALAPFDTQRGA